jgi:RNA polymerase sigma-70 factor (ECF subfamily)
VANPPTTHATLLARLSDSTDTRAWREFCDRYGELIRTYARRRGLQPADCEDVLQEVLLGLSRAMPGFEYDPERGRFRGYLKTFVSRAVNHRLRQVYAAAGQQSMEEADAGPGEDAHTAVWEDEWRAYHLRQAWQAVGGELSTRHRLAFEALLLDGRDARETAELFEMTLDQVYQIKSRGLRRLSEQIQEQIRDEG